MARTTLGDTAAATGAGTATLGQNLAVLWAVMRKEWLIHLRYPMNLIMRFVEPLMWMAPVYFLGMSFSEDGQALGFAGTTGTSDFVAYILLGTVVGSYISAVFWGMGFSLKQEMEQGTLESLWLTPNSRLWLLIGRSTVSVLITGLNTVSVMLGAYFLFGFEIGGSIVQALLILVPTVIGLYGFGIAYAGIVLYLREANTLTDVGNYFIGLLSGEHFPVTSLPKVLFIAGLTLPMTYAIDALRTLLLQTTPIVALPISIGIIVASMFAFMFVGNKVFERIDAKVRSLGTLSTH